MLRRIFALLVPKALPVRAAGACALAAGLLLAGGASAEGMTKAEYFAGRAQISEQSRAEKENCAALEGNASDICVQEAHARETNALSELKVMYQPSAKNRYKARAKKAQVEFGIAKLKCSQRAAKLRDVCVKDAQDVEDNAKSLARAMFAQL